MSPSFYSAEKGALPTSRGTADYTAGGGLGLTETDGGNTTGLDFFLGSDVSMRDSSMATEPQRRSISAESILSRGPSSADSIISEATSPRNQQSLSNDIASRPKPKRKRENRYKNAPPAVVSRRRAQNRASQRAYRERKDQRIKDLEELLEEANQKEETLSRAYVTLQNEYDKLVAGAGVIGGQTEAMMFHDSDFLAGAGAVMAEEFHNEQGFGLMDVTGDGDMLAGLYLQEGSSTYPPL